MNRAKYKWRDRIATRLLTLLGFGATFSFMACYAPPPADLDYIDPVEVAADTIDDESNPIDPTEEARP